MMMTLLMIFVVTGALLIGALWGLYLPLSKSWEGFLIALAGGALIVSVMLEMVEPAGQVLSFAALAASLAAGALCFTLADWFLSEKMRAAGGIGLLLAITLDGVPENLALGVSLIGADPLSVAALAGSILLSNLPEAAGGAKQMHESGRSKPAVLALWTGAAVLLAAAALAGNLLLADAGAPPLAYMRSFAAGAVTASLATEIFPKAFKQEHFGTGIAIALGLIVAYGLTQLSGG